MSAFLSFAIQPMEGKALLPWFGGASSVWAVGLLFFTAILFAGYLYVFLLVRYAGDRHTSIHRSVIIGALLLTVLSPLLRSMPGEELGWTGEGGIPPQLRLLLALFVTLGAPCFLLATTSPLLQYWWGRGGGGEPYRLYSLSNIGSLLALLVYPLFIEPLFPLEVQRWGWYLLFTLFGGFYLLAARRVKVDRRDDGGPGEVVPDRVRRLLVALSHMGYAAIPAYLVVAVTTHITQVLAPVPLLWTIPLALYLISWILAFRGIGRSIGPVIALLLVAGLVFRAEGGDRTVQAELQIAAALLFLFLSGLAFHGRLYALRPPVPQLPQFFLLLSAGGVLGTLGGSLLPPLLFPDLWEYPVGVPLVVAAGGSLLASTLAARGTRRPAVYAIRVAALVLAALGFASSILEKPGNRLTRSRNFYGTASVSLEGDLVVLSHGKTRHGSQFSDEERSRIPTAYYAPTSGAGRAARYLTEDLERPVRFGLVGLGAGTLAAYCRPGDTFVFYELDPRITLLARRYFSYLERCPGVAVRHGDARIVLQRDRSSGKRGEYDLLAIDAFSDDAVPMHLLTLEAFRLYLDHLAPEGILAVHTSNLYIELSPVVIRIAQELGWSFLVVHDWEQATPGAAVSDWVLLAPDPAVFRSEVFASVDPYLPMTKAPLWTDTHSSILPLLRGYQLLTRRLGG